MDANPASPTTARGRPAKVPPTEAMGHLAWGGTAILSITNRTICLNKRKQKLQRVAGAP